MIATCHLNAFQALELAMRLGSLKAAADILSISPAAVGQRIKTLEDYLGVELIIRSRKGLRPSAELVGALPNLRKAFSELGAAAEMLDLQRVNEIHIAANSDWVDLWLMPRLGGFRDEFPNVRFCINGEGDAPIRIGKTDIEVMFKSVQRSDDVDILFKDYLAPLASQENVERTACLRSVNRLEGFPLLHLDFYKDDPAAISWPDWIAAHGHRKSAPERGIRFQRIAPGLEAVASNSGFMICGLALITDRIDRKEFTLGFPFEMGAWTSHAFQARFKQEAGRRALVRRFRAWLAAESARTRAWFTNETN